MSKRTFRRAAEREARKADRIQPLQALPTETLSAPDLLVEPIDAEEQFVPKSPSLAQIVANQTNAQLSTGPTSPEGKAIVSQNRRTHGLSGQFRALPHEDHNALLELSENVYAEYQPASDTECRLADSLVQHYWLMQRAVNLQEQLMRENLDGQVDPRRFALYLRYQTTHERSYYKAQRELQNIRKQKQKDQIGFESQKRQQEAHDARTRLTHANATKLEVDAFCRQTMEAPLPGLTRIPIEEITKACSTAIAALVYQGQYQTAG